MLQEVKIPTEPNDHALAMCSTSIKARSTLVYSVLVPFIGHCSKMTCILVNNPFIGQRIVN